MLADSSTPPPHPPAHPCPALTRVYLRINIWEDREAVFSNTLLKVYLMRQMGSSSALGGPDPLPPTAHPPDPSCSPILLPHRPPALLCLSPLLFTAHHFPNEAGDVVQVIGELLGNVPEKLDGRGQGAASVPQAQGAVHSLQDRQPRKVTPLRGPMENMGNTEKLLRQKDTARHT